MRKISADPGIVWRAGCLEAEGSSDNKNCTTVRESADGLVKRELKLSSGRRQPRRLRTVLRKQLLVPARSD